MNRFDGKKDLRINKKVQGLDGVSDSLEKNLKELEAKHPDFDTLKMSIIQKAWQDEDFKQQLMDDPKEALKKNFDVSIPEEVSVKVVEEDEKLSYFVIPKRAIDERCMPINWRPKIKFNQKDEVERFESQVNTINNQIINIKKDFRGK